MDNFDKIVQSSARARYTHAPRCPRGVPTASVRGRKRRGAAWRDVTPPLPPSLNLHFLWVLSERVCVCVRAGAIQYFPNKAESGRHTSYTRRLSGDALMRPEPLCHFKY